MGGEDNAILPMYRDLGRGGILVRAGAIMISFNEQFCRYFVRAELLLFCNVFTSLFLKCSEGVLNVLGRFVCMDAFPTPSSSRICWTQMHCYQVLSPVHQHLARAHLVHVPKYTAIRCYHRLANIKCEVELVSCWQLVAYYVLLNFNFWCSSSGVSGERSAHKAWSWSSNLFLFAFHYKQIITRGSKFRNCLRRFRFDSTSPMRLQILTRQISLSSVNKCRFYILVFTVKIELNRTIRLGDVKETNRTQAPKQQTAGNWKCRTRTRQGSHWLV